MGTKRRGTFFLALALALALALGLTAAAQADTLEEIIQRGELRVAVQTQGPPFSFVDKNGERTVGGILQDDSPRDGGQGGFPRF
jgi:polar amino acid transport system substrate-binding protein